MNNLILISKEGDRIEVTRDVAYVSQLLKDMTEEDLEADDVPLFKVSTRTLEKMIEFCKYVTENKNYKEIEKPISSKVMSDLVDDKWYSTFIDGVVGGTKDNLELDFLNDIVMMSNYMMIDPLFNLACGKIATLIKDETPENVRKVFGIEVSSEEAEELDTMINDEEPIE